MLLFNDLGIVLMSISIYKFMRWFTCCRHLV